MNSEQINVLHIPINESTKNSISKIKQSQPADSLIPSPQGDTRVEMWRTLVGILTGPLTSNACPWLPLPNPLNLKSIRNRTNLSLQ